MVTSEGERYKLIRFGSTVDGRPQYNDPLFYNGRVYSFLQQKGGAVGVHRFKIEPSGLPSEPETFPELKLSRSKGFISACQYKGRIYVFGDQDLGDFKWSIRYKVSVDVDLGKWEGQESGQKEELGYDTGLKPQYSNWGIRGLPQTLRAVEFNGKLYLFYWRDGHVFFASYDGNRERKWTEIGALGSGGTKARLEAHFNVVVVQRKNAKGKLEPVICFCGTATDKQSHAQLSYIDAKHGISLAAHEVEYSYASSKNHIGMAYGTLLGARAQNVVQMFFNHTDDAFGYQQLRRTEVDVDTGEVQAGTWVDTGINNFHGGVPGALKDIHVRCDVAAVPVKSPGSPDFRHHFWVFTTHDRDRWGGATMQVSSYSSDLFKRSHDVRRDMADEPGTWALLGVIEGVPPFTRNGRRDTGATSSVLYGRSRSEQVRVTQSFQTTVGLDLGINYIADAGYSFRHSFGVSTEMTKSWTSEINYHWPNEEINEQGEYGWLLLSVPTIRNQIFDRYAQGGSVLLGSMHVTSVEGVRLRPTKFLLEKPEPGMAPRPRTSNLKAWTQELPTYDGVKSFPTDDAIYLQPDNRTVDIALKIQEQRSAASTGSFSATITQGINIQDIFKLSGMGELSFGWGIEQTSEISERIHATMTLPKPEPGAPHPVRELEVQPAWFLAEAGATFDPDKRPHWIPDQFARRSLIPWCLTWRVTTLKNE